MLQSQGNMLFYFLMNFLHLIVFFKQQRIYIDGLKTFDIRILDVFYLELLASLIEVMKMEG
jgi:hypothetical protein